MKELALTKAELQENKREMIGYTENQKEREEKISKYSKELKELKTNFDDLELKHGTLLISNEKL